MKQNIMIETKDGRIKLQFEKCKTCDYHEFCYLDNGVYHNRVPNGLSEECFNR